MDNNDKLRELNKRLEDLRNRNPSHCSGISGFMDHSISPELFQEIEDLEEEIRATEKSGKED